jgi:YjbE family integral membrane protein
MLPRPLPHFVLDFLSIVLIDLLLAGDNALVIALVVRGLPGHQRRPAVACGAALAVVLRVALTFFAARLLEVEYLRLAGGAFILWIAIKVLTDASGEQSKERAPASLLQAIGWIVMADLTMSTDNILAVAGASHGSFGLILFGLGLSIPFLVVSSSLLSKLMDRYPAIVYIGAAILGRVGGEMMLTDTRVVRALHPSDAVRWTAEASLAIAVVLVGWLLSRRARKSAVNPQQLIG